MMSSKGDMWFYGGMTILGAISVLLMSLIHQYVMAGIVLGCSLILGVIFLRELRKHIHAKRRNKE